MWDSKNIKAKLKAPVFIKEGISYDYSNERGETCKRMGKAFSQYIFSLFVENSLSLHPKKL